jgi:hypothetical protein
MIHANNVHKVSDTNEVETEKHMRSLEFMTLAKNKYGNNPKKFKEVVNEFNSMKTLEDVDEIFSRLETMKDFDK